MLDVPRPTSQQRALSLLLVALVHAALLFAALRFTVATPSGEATWATGRVLEMIISTARKPVPVRTPAPRITRTPMLPNPGGEYSGAMPSYAPPVALPDIIGLGQAIFGCAPENIPNLTPDQRAHCTNGFSRPDNDPLIEPKSFVKNPARREAEMAVKNTPAHVPCGGFKVGGGPEWLGLDLGCIATGVFGKGFAPMRGLEK